jgi:hypothetical protein
MPGQELLGAPPGPGGGLRDVEHGCLPVVEGVPGVLLNVDFRVLAAPHGLFDASHLVTRYVRVVPAEMELDRSADPRQHVQIAGHRRAVEGDHGVDFSPGRQEVGDRATQAEADDREAAVHLRQRGEALERGQGVVNAQPEIEPRGQSQRLGQALLVVGGPVPRLDPPEQVGRRDDVAERGQILGDRLDVVTDAVDLLDQQHAGAAPGLGQPYRQVKRPVGRADALDT